MRDQACRRPAERSRYGYRRGPIADDGGLLAVTMKGQSFDCKRCRAVLERQHANKLYRAEVR
jgi:hypothetical protein